MHIVLVTTELATSNNITGGLGTFTANIARIFAQNKHKVTILLASVKEQNIIFDENIPVEITFIRKAIWNVFDKTAKIFALGNKEKALDVRNTFNNVYKSLQVRKKINEINKHEKIDIVHYCNLGALAFWAKPDLPYVIRISGLGNVGRGANTPGGSVNYEDNKCLLNEKVAEYAMRKARYIISPSKVYAEIVQNHIQDNTTVIESPYVLSETNYDKCIYESNIEGKKYIIHYGRLGYSKGTHIVAQIAKTFLQTYPSFYLVLAGQNRDMVDEDGMTIKAAQLVIKNAGEFSNRIIYAGCLTREQVYPLIQNADLCLLPARMENLSNTGIEAMAMGKIVVATDGASYEQLIDDRVNGFLAERDNPDSYLKAINEALNLNEDEKREMEAKALKTAERFHPQLIINQYLDFYKEVIEKW